MEITLICYAVLQELISEEPFALEIPEEYTAKQVIELLSQIYPIAAPILKSTRLAHQDDYVDKQSILTNGAEYCLIPPVSGG